MRKTLKIAFGFMIAGGFLLMIGQAGRNLVSASTEVDYESLTFFLTINIIIGISLLILALVFFIFAMLQREHK
jgi:heme/copper-type cytochrome/quinol oxidase subunit 2